MKVANPLSRVVWLLTALVMVASTADAQFFKVWRTESGGNGHAYILREGDGIDWMQSAQAQQQYNAHLAALSTQAEAIWVMNNVLLPASTSGGQPGGMGWNGYWGPWFGAYKEDGVWKWVSGDPWVWDPWTAGLCEAPDNFCPSGEETVLRFANQSCENGVIALQWEDVVPTFICQGGDECDQPDGGWYSPFPRTYIVEYEHDCDSNGVVDAVEILDGIASDRDYDMIPDKCECDTDLTGDGVVDATDFSLFLQMYSGDLEAGTESLPADFNDDGYVNAMDMSIILGDWGFVCQGCDFC